MFIFRARAGHEVSCEDPIEIVLFIIIIIILSNSKSRFWGPEHAPKLTIFGIHIGTGQKLRILK